MHAGPGSRSVRGLLLTRVAEQEQVVNFFEELADVKIMVDQLIYLHDQTAPEDYDVESEVEFKITRQLKRIAEEELSK